MGKFNKKSTAEQVSEGVDLIGRTAIVTGANTGIGWETARVLALRGAHVILACRDAAKAEEARQRIVASGAAPAERIELGKLDLSVLDSVRRFAADFVASSRPLHLLINNAGIMIPMRRETQDGFEAHFGINHLGHFLLTNLLLGPLRTGGAAGGARVVCVSSSAMQFASLTDEFVDLDWKTKKWSGMRSYGDSKLMNAMFAVELNERYESEGVVSNALHPGIIGTDLARDQPWWMSVVGLLMLPVAKSIAQGAATTVLAATAPEYAKRGGLFLGDCSEWKHHPLALDATARAALWAKSEALTGAA